MMFCERVGKHLLMQAKKSLGQNFLTNKSIIQKIGSLFEFQNDDLIIEIGPGRGALTSFLCTLPGNLLCIEIDQDMHQYLDQYESNKCHIVYNDILQTDLNSLISEYNYQHLYVIGNLPYYITSPIITYLLNSNLAIDGMTFMVQKEVADRFCARPGHKEYGYITLVIDYFYVAKKEIFVAKNNFNPQPKVDSEVIKLTRKDNNYDIDTSKYFSFLKECFRYKRKTLKNNLKNYDFRIIKNVLEKNNYLENARPEEISQEVFIELFTKLLAKNN